MPHGFEDVGHNDPRNTQCSDPLNVALAYPSLHPLICRSFASLGKFGVATQRAFDGMLDLCILDAKWICLPQHTVYGTQAGDEVDTPVLGNHLRLQLSPELSTQRGQHNLGPSTLLSEAIQNSSS